jgi:hypothetical protein
LQDGGYQITHSAKSFNGFPELAESKMGDNARMTHPIVGEGNIDGPVYGTIWRYFR